MQCKQALHFRACVAQALKPSFSLITCIREKQRAGAGLQLSDQILVLPQSEMASPWKTINAVRQDAFDLEPSLRSSGDQAWLTCFPESVPCRFFKISDRGADRLGLQFRALLP